MQIFDVFYIVSKTLACIAGNKGINVKASPLLIADAIHTFAASRGGEENTGIVYGLSVTFGNSRILLSTALLLTRIFLQSSTTMNAQANA